MFQEMIKLSQIAESFEKQGNTEAGAILTASMKRISRLITDPTEKGEALWAHRDKVFRYVKSRYPGLSAQEIEDAVQDAILEILTSGAPLDTDQNISSYFIQSALNNAGQRKKRRERFEESETGMGAQFGDSEEGMPGMIESQQPIQGRMGTIDDPTAEMAAFNVWKNPTKRKTEKVRELGVPGSPATPSSPITPSSPVRKELPTDESILPTEEPEITPEEPKVSQEQIKSMFGSPQDLLTEAIFGNGTKEEIASGALVEPAIEFMRQSAEGRGGLRKLIDNPFKEISSEAWAEALKQILALYFAGLRGHRKGAAESTTGGNLEAIRESIPGLEKLNHATWGFRCNQIKNALKMAIIDQEFAKQLAANPDREQATEATIAAFPNSEQMTEFLAYSSGKGITTKHKMPLADVIRVVTAGGFGFFPTKEDYIRVLGYMPEAAKGQGSKTILRNQPKVQARVFTRRTI